MINRLVPANAMGIFKRDPSVHCRHRLVDFVPVSCRTHSGGMFFTWQLRIFYLLVCKAMGDACTFATRQTYTYRCDPDKPPARDMSSSSEVSHLQSFIDEY